MVLDIDSNTPKLERRRLGAASFKEVSRQRLET